MNVQEGYQIIEKSLLDGRGSPLPILANLAGFLNQQFTKNNIKINWCGFYIVNKNKTALVLNNFSIGLPACVRLNLDINVISHKLQASKTKITKISKINFKQVRPLFGVCAAGILEEESIYVENVHNYPGHIACDDASNSELVVPILDSNGSYIAVLDIDSPEVGGIGNLEFRESIEKVISFVNDFADEIDWNSLRNTLR